MSNLWPVKPGASPDLRLRSGDKGTAWLTEEVSEAYPPANGEHYIRISRLGPANDYQVLYQSDGARDLLAEQTGESWQPSHRPAVPNRSARP